MKSNIVKLIMIVFLILVILSILAINYSFKIKEEDKTDLPKAENNIKENSVKWDEVTNEGVNEEEFLKNMDIEALQIIAGELQTLVNEEIKKERDNPESVIKGEWIQVFESEHYKKVINMGPKAMKPLYWIIYKSENSGLYEYICSKALSEISGYNFHNEDGTKTWASSKEFLEKFNEKILSED